MIEILTSKANERRGKELEKKTLIPDISDDEYEAEWLAVRLGVENSLSPSWGNMYTSGVGNDYMLANEYTLDRHAMFSMGIYGNTIFCRDFLTAIQSYLKSLSRYWIVEVAVEPEFDDEAEIGWGSITITPDQTLLSPLYKKHHGVWSTIFSRTLKEAKNCEQSPSYFRKFNKTS